MKEYKRVYSSTNVAMKKMESENKTIISENGKIR